MESNVLLANPVQQSSANGAVFRIAAGEYSAAFTSRGAALSELQWAGRDLVVPFDPDLPIPDYRGIIAAPWPNRIADGAYRWEGVVQHLPLNEPDRGTALHGLVFDRLWEVEKHCADSLTLRCAIEPSKGYPGPLSLVAEYRIDADGLHTTVTASNPGVGRVPYGVCPHPYLVAGPAPLDEWTLHLDAAEFLDVTPDRLLPLGLRPVDGHPFDFRATKIIGATEIDHAFTSIAADITDTSELTITDPSGSHVGMRWDASCKWLQIHTADKPDAAISRRGLAVEPMTCPPDAFNSGTSLIALEPGATHSASWTIFGG